MVQGLIDVHVRRPDLSWADMFAELDEIAKPLLEVGWRQLDDTHTSVEPGHADAVAYDFERGGQVVEVELDEDGVLVGWPVGAEDDDLDDPADPLFIVREGDPNTRLAALRAQGWLTREE